MDSNLEEEKNSFDVIYYIFRCVTLPIFLVGGILCVLYSGIVGTIWFFQERRFRKQMQEQGRFIIWNDLVTKLRQGQGTIILEGQNKMPNRVWWTQDDVPALYAEALPLEQELLEASYNYYGSTTGEAHSLDEAHPFVEWCFNRYLNPDDGLAFLTDAPRSIMKEVAGFDSAELFKSEFPNIQAIDTVRKV